jgi:hypothetical protein
LNEDQALKLKGLVFFVAVSWGVKAERKAERKAGLVRFDSGFMHMKENIPISKFDIKRPTICNS